MKKLVIILSLAGMAVMAVDAWAAQSSGLCAAALKAAPAMTECRESPRGVVIGTDVSAVMAAARAAAEGEQRFRAFFNRPVPSYVVTLATESGFYGALRQSGFKIIQPWLGPDAKAVAIDQSVRRAVLKAVEGKNMTPEQIEAMVAQARSKLPPIPAAKAEDTDAGALAHELGHQWFMEAFWPGQKVRKPGHYGGPAPDWMDELAAVLCETDQMTTDRRRQFKTIYLQQPGSEALADVRSHALTDLETYLTREHPLNSTAREAVKRIELETGQTSAVTVITGAEARAMGRDGLIFYLQSRVFADFVIERTGNPRIFAVIAVAHARGSSFPAWLAKNGRKVKLPTTIAKLQTEWEVWLKVKYAGP